jgi:hypothetical protein
VTAVQSFTRVFVSHHQFQVGAGRETGDHLGLYTVGDDLLQVTGRAELTVMTGPHTGHVEVRARALGSAPDDDLDGWHAASESTLWSPGGQASICGLMGDCPDELVTTVSDRPGLLRVRVLARNRRPEEQPPDPLAPEQYEVALWPVDEDTGFRSLRVDDMPPAVWSPNSARAAAWAMPRLVALANPDPREVLLRRAAGAIADPPVDRVRVRRTRTIPEAWAGAFARRPADHIGATVDGEELVLPAGDVEVRLGQIATQEGFAARWRWAARPGSSTAVPDSVESTVHIGDGAELTVLHEGVRAADAVLLGLVWDYLLDRVEAVAAGGSPPGHPWVPVFDELAARAEASRRGEAAFEARRWGGTAPAPRVRMLAANAFGLARLDRSLLDSLADATEAVQHAVATWAARRACEVAGLAAIDWIAPALAALDQGAPLPPPFDGDQDPWDRLWADRRVPNRTVTIPSGTRNCSQQAIAFPAIRAAAQQDALAGAVDAVYFAALAYGDKHRDLLAAARERL